MDLKKYGKFYFTIIMITLLGSFSNEIIAQEYPYGYRSSLLLGRGDTGIADVDNEDAIFYNPGAVAFGNGIYKKTVPFSVGLQVSNSTKDTITKVSLQDEETTDALRDTIGVPQHIGFNVFSGIILKRAAIGAYGTSTTNILVAKDPTEGAIEKASIKSVSSGGLAFSFAQDFYGNQAVGVTTRFVNKFEANAEFIATDAEQTNNSLPASGSGFAIDVGYLFKHKGPTNFNLGLTIQDFMGTSYEVTQTGSSGTLADDPMKINIGFMLEKVARLSSFKFLMDYRDISNATDMTMVKRLHIGSEISIDGYLGFTVGLNQGYPTVGAYADIRLLRIDAGVYSEEMGERAGERPDKRVFIRVMMGI